MNRTLLAMLYVTLLLATPIMLEHANAQSSSPHAIPAKSSSGFKRVIIYYGWLSTSNLPSLDLDIAIVAGSSRILPGGDDRSVLEQLLEERAEVYAYLHDDNDNPVGLGSSFKAMVVDNTSGPGGENQLLESKIESYPT